MKRDEEPPMDMANNEPNVSPLDYAAGAVQERLNDNAFGKAFFYDASGTVRSASNYPEWNSSDFGIVTRLKRFFGGFTPLTVPAR